MITKYLKVFIPIFIIELSLILSGFWMLGDYEVKRFNVWPISEWLINYQAGFVRRGLFGEFLYQLNFSKGIIPILNQLVLGFYYLYIAIFVSIYLRSFVRSTKVLVIALLIPGGIFHMAIGVIFYTRKEILFLIHFGLLCLLYLNIRNATSDKKTKWIWMFGLLAIIGGSGLTLIHEPYLFMAYPITLLLTGITLLENKKYYLIRFFILGYAFLIPIIFMICTLHHGDQQISQLIWDSYALSDRIALAPFSPYTSSLATGGLGWSLMQHLSTIYGVYISGTWVYWVFFIFLNGWILSWIAFKLKKNDENLCVEKPNKSISKTVVNDYVVVVMISYLISLSMLLIASDYGRWIAFASNSCILFALTIRDSIIFRTRKIYENKIFIKLYVAIEKLNKNSCVMFFLLSYELIFQMPECCIQTPDIFIHYEKFIKILIEFIKISKN